MRNAIVGILVLLLLPLASVHATESPSGHSGPIAPIEAIQLAANDPARGVAGVFEFEVRRSGNDHRFFYLGSEKDYRDQRCLTIKMTRGNAAGLGKQLGLSIQDGLIGRRIRVHGTAKRERINITSSGRSTGLYYYQTQIFVGNPDQIQLLEGA